PTAEKRAAILFDLGQMFEKEVGDLQRAFTVRLASYKELPREEEWDDLARLAAATGTWSDLLGVLDEVVLARPDDERAKAWVRLARLYADKMNANDQALEAIDAALKLDATLTDALELRLTLLTRLARWPELAAALGAAGRLVEQADVLESHVGDMP